MTDAPLYQLFARGPNFLFNTNGRKISFSVIDQIQGFEYYNDGSISTINYESKTSPKVYIQRDDKWNLGIQFDDKESMKIKS